MGSADTKMSMTRFLLEVLIAHELEGLRSTDGNTSSVFWVHRRERHCLCLETPSQRSRGREFSEQSRGSVPFAARRRVKAHRHEDLPCPRALRSSMWLEIGVAGGVWRDMAGKATWLSEWS